MWTVLIFLFLGGYWLLRGLFAGAEKTVERTGNFLERITDESRIKMLGKYYTDEHEVYKKSYDKWLHMSRSEKSDLAAELSIEIYGTDEKWYFVSGKLPEIMTYKEGYISRLVMWAGHMPESIALPFIKWRRDIIAKNTGVRLPIYQTLPAKCEEDYDYEPMYYIHIPVGKYKTIE